MTHSPLRPKNLSKRIPTLEGTWRRLVCLWVLGTALAAHAGPPVGTLPGRKPDSTEPWGAFLGRASHEAIGRQYKTEHPSNRVFLNHINLSTIVEDAGLGDPQNLSEFTQVMRPDITDATARVLFEIKPDTEPERVKGREQAGRYLTALNGVIDTDKKFTGGKGFEGSLFLEFENGGVLWELSWRTPEPGVTLYRWSQRDKKLGASFKERALQVQKPISREEAEQRGELVEKVLRAAYKEGEWPDAFDGGQVYLPVDCKVRGCPRPTPL